MDLHFPPSELEPLVLLHGLGMSAHVWDDVRSPLAAHHDVVTPTAVGHRGGARPGRRPMTIADLADDAERALDARGLDRAHFAGNSLGGWIAIELARRGRARTVCALSPAGSWTAGTAEQTDGVRRIRRLRRMTRLGRHLPLVRVPLIRRLALRDVAEHGERLAPARAVEAGEDLLGCTILDDVLITPEQLPALDPHPCPITLAWSGADRILTPAVNGAIARQRLPGATFVVLDGVGHVPMIDDPRLVAATILRQTSSAQAAKRSSRAGVMVREAPTQLL
jgi:pimeloyl-ACP methyl ester carboxylesterase